MSEQANTPAFRQIAATVDHFPDIATHPNYQNFVAVTEDHFRQLETLKDGAESEAGHDA